MPIVNLDEPTLYPNLVFIGHNVNVPVISDTVVLTPKYSEHTVVLDHISDDVRKNSVVEIGNTKYRVMSVTPKTIYEHSTIVLLRGPLSSNLPFTNTDIIKPYHYVHQIDSDMPTDSSISYHIQPNLGMYLYLDYTKGIETDIRIYFTVRDVKQVGLNIDTSEYNVRVVTDAIGTNISYNLKLDATGKYMLPVNITEPTHILTANFVYTGAGVTAATGGLINVFVNTDTNYYNN